MTGKVEIYAEWDFGVDAGVFILEAINLLADNKSLKRLDGEGWSVYWAGEVVRVDLKKEFLEY